MSSVISRTAMACAALIVAWSATTYSAAAGPYNETMDRATQEKIDGFVWLSGEAAKGNQIARSNLDFLVSYYGPELAEKAVAAAIETWGIEVADLAR